MAINTSLKFTTRPESVTVKGVTFTLVNDNEYITTLDQICAHFGLAKRTALQRLEKAGLNPEFIDCKAINVIAKPLSHKAKDYSNAAMDLMYYLVKATQPQETKLGDDEVWMEQGSFNFDAVEPSTPNPTDPTDPTDPAPTPVAAPVAEISEDEIANSTGFYCDENGVHFFNDAAGVAEAQETVAEATDAAAVEAEAQADAAAKAKAIEQIAADDDFVTGPVVEVTEDSAPVAPVAIETPAQVLQAVKPLPQLIKPIAYNMTAAPEIRDHANKDRLVTTHGLHFKQENGQCKIFLDDAVHFFDQLGTYKDNPVTIKLFVERLSAKYLIANRYYVTFEDLYTVLDGIPTRSEFVCKHTVCVATKETEEVTIKTMTDVLRVLPAMMAREIERINGNFTYDTEAFMSAGVNPVMYSYDVVCSKRYLISDYALAPVPVLNKIPAVIEAAQVAPAAPVIVNKAAPAVELIDSVKIELVAPVAPVTSVVPATTAAPENDAVEAKVPAMIYRPAKALPTPFFAKTVKQFIASPALIINSNDFFNPIVFDYEAGQYTATVHEVVNFFSKLAPKGAVTLELFAERLGNTDRADYNQYTALTFADMQTALEGVPAKRGVVLSVDYSDGTEQELKITQLTEVLRYLPSALAYSVMFAHELEVADRLHKSDPYSFAMEAMFTKEFSCDEYELVAVPVVTDSAEAEAVLTGAAGVASADKVVPEIEQTDAAVTAEPVEIADVADAIDAVEDVDLNAAVEAADLNAAVEAADLNAADCYFDAAAMLGKNTFADPTRAYHNDGEPIGSAGLSAFTAQMIYDFRTDNLGDLTKPLTAVAPEVADKLCGPFRQVDFVRFADKVITYTGEVCKGASDDDKHVIFEDLDGLRDYNGRPWTNQVEFFFTKLRADRGAETNANGYTPLSYDDLKGGVFVYVPAIANQWADYACLQAETASQRGDRKTSSRWLKKSTPDYLYRLFADDYSFSKTNIISFGRVMAKVVATEDLDLICYLNQFTITAVKFIGQA